jgi:hypothetical protein
MGKIKAKAGIPVFGQLLSLISRKDFQTALEWTKADFAVKKLKTWDLMVSMNFAVYQRTSDGLLRNGWHNDVQNNQLDGPVDPQVPG